MGAGRQPEDGGARVPEVTPEFEIDGRMDDKLLISVAPSGYLRRLR